MVRRLGFAGVIALAAAALPLALAAVPSVAACGSSPCPSPARASVAPQDVLAGTTTTFNVDVFNDGNITLDSIRIVRPSTRFTVTGASGAPSGWTGAVDAPDHVSWATFSNPVGLAPGQSATFGVTAAAGTATADTTAPWSVLARNKAANFPNGNNYAAVPGKNNSVVALQETIHILSTGRAALVPPAADEGAVTAGQTVSARLPVTNVSAGSITLSTTDSRVKGDTDGTVAGGKLRSPVTIAPGATADAIFDGITFPQAASNVVVRFIVADNATPVLQGAARTVEVQNPATFSPHSPDLFGTDLSCSPSPANAGRPLSCTVDVDKGGDPAATLSTATALRFADDAGHSFSAALTSPASFSPGGDRQTLSFSAASVPAGFHGGSYEPTLVWAGTDANGAAVSEPPSTVASSVTFDDAPSITSAARGSDGAANPVVGLTMSEPVVGTYNVDNWQVVDSAGTYHAVASVSGSGSGFWKLTLARSPAVAPGTLTVRYAPGDLHDRENSPLPPSTVTTT